MTLTRDEIFSDVARILADSLAIDKSEIALKSRLIDDLGLDSLDLLDVIFSLERRFELKLRDAELSELLRGDFLKDKVGPDGALSADALKRYGTVLPELASAAAQGKKITPLSLLQYLTVETLVVAVAARLPV